MMTMSVQDYRQIAYFNLQFLPEKKNASITSNMEVLNVMIGCFIHHCGLARLKKS